MFLLSEETLKTLIFVLAVECVAPGLINMNAVQENLRKYHYGDIQELECKPGFQTMGSLSIRCEANGQWSEIRGQCLKN